MGPSLGGDLMVAAVVVHVFHAVGVGVPPVRIGRRRRVGNDRVRAPRSILGRMVLQGHVANLVVSGARAVSLRRSRPEGWVWLSRVGDWGALADDGVLATEGRALGRVPVLVPVAQVQSDEGPIAITPVASVDLLGVMVQLVAVAFGIWSVVHPAAKKVVHAGGVLIQVLCAGVALAAVLLGAFELLVEALAAPPPFPSGAVRV